MQGALAFSDPMSMRADVDLVDAGEVEQEGVFEGRLPVAFEAARRAAVAGAHVGFQEQPVVVGFQGP